MAQQTATTVVATCHMCKEEHPIAVRTKDYQNWENGMHIQDAFPYLKAEVRELLISGTCPICWDTLFGDE